MTDFLKLRVVIAAVIVVGAFSGCGSGDESAQPATPTKPTQSVVCPMDADGAKSFDASTLVGQSLADAKVEAAKYDCSVRAVEVDGKPMAATMDFNRSRINVSVKDDKVTEIQSVG